MDESNENVVAANEQAPLLPNEQPPPTSDAEEVPIPETPDTPATPVTPSPSQHSQSSTRRERKRATLIKLILLTVVLFIFSFIIFGIFLFKSKGDSNEEEEEEVCLRPECIITSARILSSMNAEVDPCDDFYQFTCGNWIAENVIPDDKTRISTFDSIFKKNINILRNALEGDYKEDEKLSEEQQNYDKQIFNQLKNIYEVCIDTDKIEEKGKEPLIKLLQQLKIDENKEAYGDSTELTELIVKLHNVGSSAFFDMAVAADQKNPDLNVIYIGQSGLGLPSKEYYEEEDILAVYKETIKDMFDNIFDDRNNAEATADLIINFEKKLAEVTIPSQDMQDPSATYNENNMTTLSKNYPNIDWKLYLEKRFNTYAIEDAVNENSLIIVDAPKYFEGLSAILKETDSETLTAYAEWHVIRVYGKYIKERLQEPLKKLRKTLTGVKIDPPRSEYCVRIVDGIMGMAASKLFIEKAFAGDSKQAAEKTIEYIKEAMNHRIPQMPWIDRQTRNLAIRKVFSLTDKIGYPDFVMDPEKVKEEYDGLEIVEDDFFTNIVNSNSFDIGKNLKDIKKPVDRSKWEMTPQTVNAYYNPPMNEIVFPAGILQTPFFSAKDPYYLNYGGIGAVVGHELTHAFDNNGRQYDSKGRLSNWWSNSTLEEFNKLSQCFIDQYESYYIEDKKGNKHHIKGKLTLGENLADNGGLARAYEAWNISYKRDVEEAKKHNYRLPGLTQYTLDQLFYISFGQIWCSKSRPESAIQRIRTDPHSPPQHRVNGAVSNSAHFSETFHCPPNAPMNPEKKCLIW